MAVQDPGQEIRSDNATVAKSAGKAFLGQSAAVVEALGLIIFTWLYAPAVVGLFFTLWAALKVLTAVTEFAMTTSQQRFTPASKTKAGDAQILKAALMVSLSISLGTALLVAWFAPEIAGYFHSGTVSKELFTTIIRIYVWALPAWTLVEVLTASVRAQRKFGPEIRVRIFYEQGLRLIGGVALFYAGLETFGLFYAHVISITLAAILAFRLASKFYDLKAVLNAPVDPAFLKEFLSFSALMMPANFIKKLFLVGSVIIVNKALGVEAAAIYGLGRHISSVLQIVHLSFEYVMAPFASLKNALAKRDELQGLYAFTTRLIVALVMPLGILLIYLSRDILTVFNPDYAAATGVIIILTAGRITEALSGTSAAVIEMLGNKMLPLANNLVGLTALFVLQYYLKVDYGVYGIALATAVGFNLISLLSLAEAYFIYGLSPYSKKTLRPLLVSFILSSMMGGFFVIADKMPHAVHFSLALISIYVALMILVRFGLSEEDARSLGRIGRWFRNFKPQTAI